MTAHHTLLLVDDNLPALQATARILRGAGYSVVEAPDGATALREVHAVRPSLVLLDVVLPDIAGTEILKQIRADPTLQGISVVLFSSQKIESVDRVTGLDTGADGYILRPIGSAELLARVRAQLRQHELASALRASEARYSAVVEQSPEAIIVHREGRLLYVNPSGLRLVGAETAAETVGRPLATFLPPDLQPIGAVGSLLQQGRCLRLDGRILDLEFRQALMIYDGAPAMLCFLHDITERKRTEMEREKLIADLQAAQAQVRILSGRLPICASCKKIRDEADQWKPVEEYIQSRSLAHFSHGICPECRLKLYPGYPAAASGDPAAH